MQRCRRRPHAPSAAALRGPMPCPAPSAAAVLAPRAWWLRRGRAPRGTRLGRAATAAAQRLMPGRLAE
eukprot:8198863-Alexandrium_andersonii.AAC.1